MKIVEIKHEGVFNQLIIFAHHLPIPCVEDAILPVNLFVVLYIRILPVTPR